jgi:purine nucleosidase
MFFSRSALKKLADSTRTEAFPLVDTLVAAMSFYQEFHLKAEGLLGCIVNDPLAVMLSFHPEMGECKPMYVHVDCSNGYTRGQSVCDRFGLLNRKPNAQVYLQVESRAAMYQVWDRIAPGVLAADDF